MTPIRIDVPPLDEPRRLDRFLQEGELDASRSQIKTWVDAGRVAVDGEARKAGHRLRGGEVVEVSPPEPEVDRVEAENIPLVVLYEDEDLVAIDKPAGMVVHPAPGLRRGTLVNALLHHGYVAPADALSPERPGIVHRLDKETSGVIVVARHRRAHEALGRAFQEREVKKRYRAFVLGVPKASEGRIDREIGRHPTERQRMSTHGVRGRAAVTEWRVLSRYPGAAEILAMPETGRTHQIRVHLLSIGHPILGDAVYGSKRGRVQAPNGRARDLTRHALHAAAIDFPHPSDGRRVRVEAPLPEDLEALARALDPTAHAD